VTAAGWARVRVAVLLVVGIVVQTTLAGDVRVDTVAPDLMLMLAIAGGLACGSEAGAVIGFFAGLLSDLSLTTTPLGLYALAWCLVGWGVGMLRTNLLPEGRAVQPLVGFAATVGGVVVLLVVGELAGQHMLVVPGRAYLVKVALVEGLWNAVLAVPVTYLMARSARGSRGADRLGRSDALAAP
jgi:rod shape-determining protein MreD